MSLVSSIVVAVLFVWPWLQTSNGEEAVIWLVAPHMFLRFIGLSFLLPGVVAGSLPKPWALPAAYRDFVAPLELFDYFLAGLPVVSTPVIPLWEFEDLIYFGETAEEFACAIRRALNEPAQSLKRKMRIEVAHAHSTEALAKHLQELGILSDTRPRSAN